MIGHSPGGLYVVFEGGEGSGKSIQARLLYERLGEEFPEREILLTKEPGGTFISDQIRTILLTPFEEEEVVEPITEVLLFSASRAESLRKIVKPAVERGGIVIGDRSFYSSLVYQGWARELGVESVWRINQEAVGGILPHKVFFLDLAAEEGLKRRELNGKFDRIDGEELEFHQRVREGYLNLVANEPDRFLVIDVTPSIEAVREVIWEKTLPLLINDETGREARIRRERE